MITTEILIAQLEPEFPTTEMEKAYAKVIKLANELDISLNKFQKPKVHYITQKNN